MRIVLALLVAVFSHGNGSHATSGTIPAWPVICEACDADQERLNMDVANGPDLNGFLVCAVLHEQLYPGILA